MTAAFNLSQLANKLNTSGQLNAADGLTGLIANSNLASSGTSSSSTFLRGDRSWQPIPTPTIASTAEAQAGTNNTNFITPLRMREGFNASGNAPVYAARAWVNFNGTGTVAIRASGNVSSIIDNGTGNYTVNFTTSLLDVNYSTNVTTYASGSNVSGGSIGKNSIPASVLTTSVKVLNQAMNTAGQVDADIVCVSIFR